MENSITDICNGTVQLSQNENVTRYPVYHSRINYLMYSNLLILLDERLCSTDEGCISEKIRSEPFRDKKYLMVCVYSLDLC